MTDASAIAREGWDLAESGSLDDAISKYERALAIADPATDDLWHIHGEFGAVLARAHEFEKSIEQHRAAATAAVRQNREVDSKAVQIERFFAASLLLHLERPEEALREIAELVASSQVLGLVRSVEAEALFALGHIEKARTAALDALARAGSVEQREGLREQLWAILVGG